MHLAYRPAEVQGAAAAQRDGRVGGLAGGQQPRRRAEQQGGDAPGGPRHRRVARLHMKTWLYI